MKPLPTAFLTRDAADGHAENDEDEEREHRKDGRHGDDGDVIGGPRSRGVLGSGRWGCGSDTIFWGGVVLTEIAGIAFHVVLETAVVSLVESVATKLKVLVAANELIGM
jgi:hypothetical protein